LQVLVDIGTRAADAQARTPNLQYYEMQRDDQGQFSVGHKEEDVKRAVRAVQTAYDDLRALRASRHSKIPSSLSNAGRALGKLGDKLTMLTVSPEALSNQVFYQYAFSQMGSSAQFSLVDAIVHDMKVTATYFRTMNSVEPAGILGDLDEQECHNIEDIVVRYKNIVSSVMSQHQECVRDESTWCIYLAH
jgi:hypothetical protein